MASCATLKGTICVDDLREMLSGLSEKFLEFIVLSLNSPLHVNGFVGVLELLMRDGWMSEWGREQPT